MKSNLFDISKFGFTISCTIAALYLSIRCIHEFSLNKDNSSVSFKNFHADDTSFYPSISLCFRDFWNDSFGFKYDYDNFLSGCQDEDEDKCKWNESFANTNYNDVTIDLKEFIIAEITFFGDKTVYMYDYGKYSDDHVKDYKANGKQIIFSGYTGEQRVYTNRKLSYQKCITFDMPFKKNTTIQHHSILLNNEVFQNRTRPKFEEFEIFFHYPNQTIRKTSNKLMWTDMTKNKLLKQSCKEYEGDDKKRCSYYGSTYTMHFDIDNVSLLKRRQKPNLPCVEKWKNDDMEMKSEIARSLNCKPSHWNISMNLKNCKTKEQMKQSMAKEENPPIDTCYGIERYSFSYNEMPGLDRFDIGFDGFLEHFNIDWNDITKDDNGVVFSEIMINFIGNRLILDLN